MKNAFLFDLQMFAEDDELGEPLNIDQSSLSDDPLQLKRLIGTLMADNSKARRSDKNQRTRRQAVEAELLTEKTAHTKTKTDLEADLTKHKTDLETANRSNGQYKTKFREQFVDQKVRAELDKRGAHNVDDAMKLLDLSKIEFDEDKLEIKNADALGTTLDAFAKERTYLFGEAKPAGQRTILGTSLGRGASDSAKSQALEKFSFDDPNKTIDQLTAEFVQTFS